MDTTVIVALPPVDDKVWKISSEKLPHLTLLYLGETEKVENLEEIVLYVKHAAEQLSPFGLTVDYRGKLGDDDADVLFFEESSWDMSRVREFRHHLLLSDAVRHAYDSVEQFPEWTPHLTLGYPETPANEDDSEDPGVRHVYFDRIMVWTGEFDGPEFRLKYDDHAMEVAMSDISTVDRGKNAVDEFFHYGVKGMKWGVRRDRAASRGGASQGPTAVVVEQKKPGKYAKSKGGQGHPLSEDAKASIELRQKAKKSTTDALSNKELQAAVTRMNLEQQYRNLSFNDDRRSKGRKFVEGLFGAKRYGQKRVYTDDFEESGDQLRKAIKDALEKPKGDD